MKRVWLPLSLVAAALLVAWLQPASGAGAGEPPSVDARSAILIDADTGMTLAAQNADEPMPPASMSKMMTELIVLDRLRDGGLSWDGKVRTSAYAAAVPGSGAGFGPGEQWTVRELFEAMTVHSANDAAVALAEAAAGSERAFVTAMNRKAQAIGLSAGTRFGNATGLSKEDLAPFAEAASGEDSRMTARDASRLARYLLRTHPEVLAVTARNDVRPAEREGELHTTNLMLPGEPFAYAGSDGLKTGYTAKAGYCFTGTAKRGSRRLIAVVMGTASSDARFEEARKLFQYGFGENVAAAGWLSRLKAALS